MASSNIPPSSTPVITPSNTLSPPWYRYLALVDRTANSAGSGEVQGVDGLTGGGQVADGVDLSIADGGVTNAKLRDGAATSVIGRYTNTAGDVADITATADGRVLCRIGGLLMFTESPEFSSLQLEVRAVTASTNVLPSDYIIVANATAGNITVTLPLVEQGRHILVKKMDASVNTVTIDGSGAQTIDGAATQVISTQYLVYSLVGGASEWHVI